MLAEPLCIMGKVRPYILTLSNRKGKIVDSIEIQVNITNLSGVDLEYHAD